MKRHLLQATSRFYDPLGLVSPLLTGGLIFQESWCGGVEWDGLLPDDLGTRWRNLITILPHLRDIHIPNGQDPGPKLTLKSMYFAMLPTGNMGLSSTSGQQTGQISSRLLFSKNRLAHSKKFPLPGLEFIAALFGSRFLNYFCKEKGHDITEVTLWSDSTVA